MKKLSVILLTLVMAFAWTASAFADATPYASVRFQTFYQDVDNGGAAADTSDLLFQLFPTNVTRFGVKYKVSDEVAGLFELGINSSGGAILRHAFGTYKFGAGELLIGQTWSPYAVFFGQVYDDTAGLRQGSAANRGQMVKVTFTPGVYVALLKSSLTEADPEDIEIPELAVGYKGKFGGIGVGIHGAYVGADTAGGEVDTYGIFADVDAKLGAVALMGRAFYGQDMGNLIGGANAISTATKAGDLDTWGVLGSVSFYPSDKLTVTVGAGYQETEAAAGDDNNELIVWANAPIKVTKGFTIVPEIAYQDALDVAGIGGVSTTADNALWVGAKWQFDL